MKLKELRQQYLKHKDNCHICGCTLEDNTGQGLGTAFCMDFQGNFYCMDHDFLLDRADTNESVDDGIFDADLYEDMDEDSEMGNVYMIPYRVHKEYRDGDLLFISPDAKLRVGHDVIASVSNGELKQFLNIHNGCLCEKDIADILSYSDYKEARRKKKR